MRLHKSPVHLGNGVWISNILIQDPASARVFRGVTHHRCHLPRLSPGSALPQPVSVPAKAILDGILAPLTLSLLVY